MFRMDYYYHNSLTSSMPLKSQSRKQLPANRWRIHTLSTSGHRRTDIWRATIIQTSKTLYPSQLWRLQWVNSPSVTDHTSEYRQKLPPPLLVFLRLRPRYTPFKLRLGYHSLRSQLTPYRWQSCPLLSFALYKLSRSLPALTGRGWQSWYHWFLPKKFQSPAYILVDSKSAMDL